MNKDKLIKKRNKLRKEIDDFQEDHFGQGWTLKMKMEEKLKSIESELSALKSEMENDKPCRFIKSCGLIEFECVGKEGCGDYEPDNNKSVMTDTVVKEIIQWTIENAFNIESQDGIHYIAIDHEEMRLNFDKWLEMERMVIEMVKDQNDKPILSAEEVKKEPEICPECEGKDVKPYKDHLCCYECGEFFKNNQLKWIAVKDYKPEGEVLLLTISKVIKIGDLYKDIWRVDGRTSWDNGTLKSQYDYLDITHWMPLPKIDI